MQRFGDSPGPTHAAAVNALDTESLDAALDAILSADPPPHVVAADPSGLCVPMPPGFVLAAQQRISGIATFLELVVAADMAAIVSAWEEARALRFARVSVCLRQDPLRPVVVSFVDARHRYGVYFGIITGASGNLNAGHDVQPLFRPRLWTMDRDALGSAQYVDPAVEEVLGWRPDELVGRRLTELIHPEDQTLSFATWTAMLGRPGCDQRALMRYRHRDGQHIWFEVTHRNLLADAKRPRVFTQLFDVSERVEAVEQLRVSEEILRRLTETLPQGVAHIDVDSRIVYKNERLLEILDVASAATLGDLLAPIALSQRNAVDAAVGAVLNAGEPLDLEVPVIRGDGVGVCSIAMRALKTAQGAVSGAILSVMDVTERERLRAELQRQAQIDTLTRCLNRAAILEVLQNALLHGTYGIGVLFIDLDGFKPINDEYGHAAGDELLRTVGQRLTDAMRTGDAVGRLGGDEFLVVCTAVETVLAAQHIATRIAAELSRPLLIGAHTIVPGASIGVAWSGAVVDAENLVARADAAMYEAKRAKSTALSSGPREARRLSIL